MFPKKSKRVATDTAKEQPGAFQKFFKEQTHTDTVVFVHGVLGHYVNTWGLFPQLISEDPDLPNLDVLLWGYRTGWLSRHNELATEGRHFVSALELLARPGDDLVLVGHSMGGLIILKGLVDRMIDGHAQSVPCCSVRWIILFASPLDGTWAAGVARVVAGPLFFVIGSLHKHLRGLCKGGFVKALMAEVVNRIYHPSVEDKYNRRIPIRIVAATRDRAVDTADRDAALAVYRDPAALQLDETHSSVKLPRHVGDLRYRVLFNDLQSGFARKFGSLCKAVMDQEAGAEQREAVLSEMLRRYGNMIRRRVCDVVARVELRESAQHELLLLMATDGAVRGTPPFDAANRATTILAARHKDWR